MLIALLNKTFPSFLVLCFVFSERDYAGYLPVDVLEAGVKSGRFVRGTLNVNKHNAMTEAFVKRSE